jgi:hypothetical protein
MSPTDLDDILNEQPAVPLRLTLSSGDQVVIDNPTRTLIAGLSLFIGLAETPEARIGDRVRIVSIPNINLIERIEGPRRNGRRRRRRQ